MIKSNLARFPEPVGLSIVETGVTFGEAPEPPQSDSQRDRATDLLLELLKDGPLNSTEVQGQAQRAGISWETMKRAKDRLGIAAKRDGKTKKWLWTLPQGGAEGPWGPRSGAC